MGLPVDCGLCTGASLVLHVRLLDMETVRFIEQLCRQPKDTVRFRRDRIQLSREWKIDDGTHILGAGPTMEPRHMRFTILAAALFLAACQTQTPQGNNAPVVADGITFALENGGDRDLLRTGISHREICMTRTRWMTEQGRIADDKRAAACDCAWNRYIDTVPDDLIERHIAEAQNRAKRLNAVEAGALVGRVETYLGQAYRHCGIQYF